MIKLKNFVYCNNVERNQIPNGGESLNAMGIVSALIPEFIPGSFSFSIVFSILGVDVTKSNSIQIVFAQKDNNKTLVDTGTISIPPTTRDEHVLIPDDYFGFNMSMDFRNVVFEEEGVYYTKSVFTGIDIGQSDIYAKSKR